MCLFILKLLLNEIIKRDSRPNEFTVMCYRFLNSSFFWLDLLDKIGILFFFITILTDTFEVQQNFITINETNVKSTLVI